MKIILALSLFAVLATAYYVLGLNRVTCAHCGHKLRRRHAVEFGDSPSAFTHAGECETQYQDVHVNRAHYGDRQ